MDDLIIFNVLNDLSAVQDVTGKVQSRIMRHLILGKTDEMCGSVAYKEVGRDHIP